MSRAYDAIQLSAIEAAATRVAQMLKAEKKNDRLIVSRAVFDIAVESDIFETDNLVKIAHEQLRPELGWRF